VTAPSGEQLRLVLGDQEAVVTEVGASLRSYRVAGRDVIAGYPSDSVAAGGRGQVLAPWPNRLEDGAYTWDGVRGRAALDEPEKGNAIHGLVRWLRWLVVERGSSWVELSCPLAPQPAYPFELSLSLRYELGAGGLRVTAVAEGVGPFGIGFHPYLALGDGSVDSAVLQLPARRRLLADGRGLPVGEEDVAGGAYDFGSPRPVGDLALDDCFTELEQAGEAGPWPDGAWVVRVVPRDTGVPLALWADAAFPWLMCYTGDTLADEAVRRRSIAVEPMTCPPNALRSGVGLVRLEPGERWFGTWGIGAAGAGAAGGAA
jgi:aldose 1-epimerase